MSAPSTSTSSGAPPCIAFLGPAGTFHEEALLSQPDLSTADLRPVATISDVLSQAESGEVDFGFAAIENSIEGSVNVTVDKLAFETTLLIQREVVIPIRLNLLVNPGTTLNQIERVVSFPHAVAQCRSYLETNLPRATVEHAGSTAQAAALVAEAGDPGVAAIGTALAAKIHGLELLGDDIEDHPENETRFVLVARTGLPAPSGHDKTSLVVFQRADRPGSLLAILHEFAARSINLTKLESRPTKQGLGDYCFLLDLEGHISDEVVGDCLKTLKAKQADVKFLGSYPAAGAHGPELRRDADRAWADASTWLEALRNQPSS